MIRYQQQFEISGIGCAYEMRERERKKKKLLRGKRSRPKSIQRRCGTRLVLTADVVRTERRCESIIPVSVGRTS